MGKDLNTEVVDEKVDASSEKVDGGGGEKPPEKSDLELKRDNLLQLGRGMESPVEKKPDEEEEEIEEYDWDTLKMDIPILEKNGYKNVKEALERLAGGFPQFQKDRDIVSALEKAGYDTPEKQKELLARIEAKEEITPAKRPEAPKSYGESRREKLSAFLPKQVIDPETEMPRGLTEEEKKFELSYLENWAESIVPAGVIDSVGEMDGRIWDLKDKLLFNLFRLEPVMEQFKDKILPDSTYSDLLKFSQEYPRTCYEIMEKAERNGQNPYKSLYHHFITTTNKDKIDAEKRKQWEEERTKEEKKKTDAKSETARRSGGEVEGGKAFKDLSLEEKRKNLAKRMNQLA